MALSLSPHPTKQPLHTSPITNTPPDLHSTSTSRQFTPAVHHAGDSKKSSHEQPEKKSLLHSSIIGHTTGGVSYGLGPDSKKLAMPTSSQELPDLPSWTPLQTGPTEDEDELLLTTGQKVDEVATTWKVASFVMNRQAPVVKLPARSPANAQATVQTTVPRQAESAIPLPSDATRPKAKKARFAGVVISTKPPPYRRFNTQSRRVSSGSDAQAASNMPAFSLVDALSRTFDANRHPDDPRDPHSSPSCATSRYDGASTGLQTDAETTTEGEDERFQLNTRLVRTPLKRPHLRRRGVIAPTDTTSKEVVSLAQRGDRPTKRHKTIPYESNKALIDRALGTVRAPVGWRVELDVISRDDGVVTCRQMARAVPAVDVVRMDADDGRNPDAARIATASSPTATALANPWRTSQAHLTAQPALSPYLSRGAQFRQRLDTAFGDDAIIRTDKAARPRLVEYELLAVPDDDEREPSPSIVSASVSGDSAVATSDIDMNDSENAPSTHVTTQSSGNTSESPLAGGELETQMQGWIVALQRLVKGKVRVNEEDLETLSIILAEIESVKDGLDQRSLASLELRESVRQLSKLYEIPFGDRNKLRQRAENISRAWPSVGELGAS